MDGTRPTIAWQIVLIGVAIREMILSLPPAIYGRGHTIATQRSCQDVHIIGRQRVTVQLLAIAGISLSGLDIFPNLTRVSERRFHDFANVLNMNYVL